MCGSFADVAGCGVVTTRRLPPSLEGPVVGGGPWPKGGAGGGALEAP